VISIVNIVPKSTVLNKSITIMNFTRLLVKESVMLMCDTSVRGWLVHMAGWPVILTGWPVTGWRGQSGCAQVLHCSWHCTEGVIDGLVLLRLRLGRSGTHNVQVKKYHNAETLQTNFSCCR